MGEPLKKDGRKMSEYVGDIDWHIAQAKAALIEAGGSTDVVVYQRQIRTAMGHLEKAHVSTHGADIICRMAAKREPYKKEVGV